MSGNGEEKRSWVDRLVVIAPYFGMSPVRLRWKLENWRRRRAEAARRREQRMDHIRYQHKTCAACGAVQDRDATACSRCGEKLARRSFQVLHRLGVFAPQWMSVSSLLGLSFVVAFARLLAVAPGGLGQVFGFDLGLLVQYGGNLPPAVLDGEYWRWLTACFLHAGLLHIGFNLFALAVIGPQVERLYGRLTMLFLFVATGVLANIGSGLAGLDGVGIGASGGLMGLVGVAAGWGQREGTTLGRAVRNDMLKWSAYVVLFGIFMDADNWAHIFGLATGFACGFAIRPQAWRTPSLAPARGLTSAAGVVAAVAALVLIARPPAGSAAAAQGPHEIMAAWVEVCRLQDGGDTDGALARAKPLLQRLHDAGKLDPTPGDAEQLRSLCLSLGQQREYCRTSPDPTLREQCDMLERAWRETEPSPGR